MSELIANPQGAEIRADQSPRQKGWAALTELPLAGQRISQMPRCSYDASTVPGSGGVQSRHGDYSAMASQRSMGSLKRANASDVARWFRQAWEDQDSYPDERRCHRVAIRVNTIVDHHNAAPKRGAAEEAIKKRRQAHLAAGKHARAPRNALHSTMDNLRDEQKLSTIEGLEPSDGDLAHHIAVTAHALAALDTFLALPPPPQFQDHMDPVLWIATAAREAWEDRPAQGLKEKMKVPFGSKPDGPLASFISLALEAIGMVGEGQAGFSLETVSDHLRRRHNRPRKRSAKARVGEN